MKLTIYSKELDFSADHYFYFHVSLCHQRMSVYLFISDKSCFHIKLYIKAIYSTTFFVYPVTEYICALYKLIGISGERNPYKGR